MRVAITGATGFLGRYIVRELAARGHELRCWYRPSSDRQEMGVDSIDWLAGSLDDEAATRALVNKVDAVVHAAVEWEGPRTRGASSHGAASVFQGVNLAGSLCLFRAAHEVGVPRFIFISTCAVHDVILGDRALDEGHPLWPTSHYGAHKAALEKFVHSYGLGNGWPICALRPTGIYGVAHPPANSRWFNLIGQVLQGETVCTDRGGKEVHAQDVARAVELLLRADAKVIAGQAFNCYDIYISEERVASIAKELTKSKSKISSLNRGPRNQIDTQKIRALGMNFGGENLLRRTVEELVRAHRA